MLQPSDWDFDLGQVANLGGNAFSVLLSDKPQPFFVSIHRHGFLQFFDAGPFTEKDIKNGVLEIDIPRPTGVDVIFDPGEIVPRDRPFESVHIEVGLQVPGKGEMPRYAVTLDNS